jgi:hypothetical protein
MLVLSVLKHGEIRLASVCLPTYLWLYSSCGPWPPFQFLNLHTVGRTPWTGDQPVAKSLPTHRTTQTQNKRTQTSMTRVGFEPTIPVFERAKRVLALDRGATVSGITTAWRDKFPFQSFTVTRSRVRCKAREVSDRMFPTVHTQYIEIPKFRSDHEPLQTDGKQLIFVQCSK